MNYQFEELIICGTKEYAEPAKELLKTNLGVEESRIVICDGMKKCNIGNHKVDWTNIMSTKQLMEALVNCEDLNDLEKYYYTKSHRSVEKLAHYLEIYDRHFQKYRDTECVIVEVGVFKGGSLQMWKDYFGSKCKIIGVDIDESVKQFEEEQISIEIGSQSDREFWKRFKEKYPKVDIFIDDGGHTMEQQIITFEEMFSHISTEGIYLCEDLHTSYWERYGGGYKKPDTFIEYSKNFIDYINAWYSENKLLQENEYTYSMQSLHYYDSVLVIEKRKMDRSFFALVE
jgi:cephalosporin hydroxylase